MEAMKQRVQSVEVEIFPSNILRTPSTVMKYLLNMFPLSLPQSRYIFPQCDLPSWTYHDGSSMCRKICMSPELFYEVFVAMSLVFFVVFCVFFFGMTFWSHLYFCPFLIENKVVSALYGFDSIIAILIHNSNYKFMYNRFLPYYLHRLRSGRKI